MKKFSKKQLESLLSDVISDKPFDAIKHEYGFNNGDLTRFFMNNYGISPSELRFEVNKGDIFRMKLNGSSIPDIAVSYDICQKQLEGYLNETMKSFPFCEILVSKTKRSETRYDKGHMPPRCVF